MSTITINNSNVTLTLVDVNNASKTYTIENSGTIPVGRYNLTLAAKDGYLINDAILKDGWGDTITFAISTDKKTATFSNYGITDDTFTLSVTTTAEQPKQIITSKVTIDNTNVAMEMVDVTDTNKTYIIDGSYDVPHGTYNITITANDGYLINSAGTKDGWGQYQNITISDDKKTATITSFVLEEDTTFSVTTIVEQPSPPTNSDGVSGFNHLYLVDKTILASVSKERFGNGIDNNDKVNDLGQYIVNVLELPFSVVEPIKGKETRITLGTVLLNTTAVELLDDEVILDVGNIVVPGKYNNSYDYLNTDIYLHLPFVQTIKLDVDYVINQTINIQYIINLFTGATSIVVRSSKINNEIILNDNVTIGKSIPFIGFDYKVIGNLRDNTPLNNQLYTAFVEVVRNKPHDMDNRFNDEATIQTQLNKESGFVTVNKIILDTMATLQEKNMIESILKNGVYIK